MALTFGVPPVSAPMIVIAGGEGSGKTTLGAMFPRPVFMQAEPVRDVFDDWHEDDVPPCMPELPMATLRNPTATLDAAINQVYDLIEDKHDFRSLIVDSASVFNTMLEQQLCVQYGVTNVAEACGGYNKYVHELAAKHLEFINALKELRRERDMGIIILSHLEVQKLKNRPDGDPVVAYGLAMEAKSASMYRQQASAVLALRVDEYVKDVEKDKKGRVTRGGRVVATGTRSIITDGSTMGYGTNLCKNRFDLPATIRFTDDKNPLLDLIPYYKTMNE